MKQKLKGLLAVVLSAACILTVMPLSGFAVEESTTQVEETTSPTDVETTVPETEEEKKEYEITYWLGEKEQYGEAKKFAAGSKIIHPESPKKDGFKFAGWILGEEDGKTIPVPETMPENDLKAYASWEIQSYKISYTIDGATIQSN